MPGKASGSRLSTGHSNSKHSPSFLNTSFNKGRQVGRGENSLLSTVRRAQWDLELIVAQRDLGAQGGLFTATFLH